MEEVQRAVVAAKEKYESKAQQSKVRKWVTKFSERMMHYGNVMDSLANYDPQYVALVWGVMKFLLMVRTREWSLRMLY